LPDFDKKALQQEESKVYNYLYIEDLNPVSIIWYDEVEGRK